MNPTIACIKEEHKEQVHIFHDTIEVEKVMIKQIIKAVNEVYLKEVMNPTTNTILNDMPTVLLHLFTNYRMIECEDSAVQVKNVAESGYNIADHITNLFSKV